MPDNRLNRNAGFGVVGVLVVVAAVLVVSFIAWRVYDANQKPQSTSNTQTSTASDAPLTATPASDPNAGYVVIEQWGVRFKPSESLGEVQYFKPKDLGQYDALTFTTKALADRVASCSPSSENIVLGLLYRNKEQSAVYGETLAKIGDYYYQYRGPQASCGAGDDGLETNALQDLTEALRSLEAAK